MNDNPPAPEVELLRRSARGDVAAFRSLYDRAAPQLFAIAERILGRRDLAEDAIQEVFISIWRHADRYAPSKGRPMTWMVSITRYKAIDMRRLRRHEVQKDDVSAEPVANDPSPLQHAASEESNRALDDCMAELAAAQRNSVRLAYLKGYSHAEVAKALGSPLGTVKSWIRRGLQALRKCLER